MEQTYFLALAGAGAAGASGPLARAATERAQAAAASRSAWVGTKQTLKGAAGTASLSCRSCSWSIPGASPVQPKEPKAPAARPRVLMASTAWTASQMASGALRLRVGAPKSTTSLSFTRPVRAAGSSKTTSWAVTWRPSSVRAAAMASARALVQP